MKDEKNNYMLKGTLGLKGYDWWWHSFTGVNARTGEEKSFFIEYFIMNPSLGSDVPRFTEEGAPRPAYVMIKAGAWGKNAKQLHRFFGTKDFEWDANELRIVAGDCFLSDEVLKGSISVPTNIAENHPEYMSDAGSMSWLLRIDRKTKFDVGYGTSKPLRIMNAFGMYWHAAGIRTEYTGSVYLDGEKYNISPVTCYGYSDKNWGSSFTNPWLWLSSCHIRRAADTEFLQDTVFDLGGGRPVVFGIPLKNKLLGKFRVEGKDYEFNFSKFWTFAQTKFRCKVTSKDVIWHVRLANRDGALEIKAMCPISDMIKIRYQAPDGSHPFKELWNGGTGRATLKLYKRGITGLNLIDEFVADHVGCEWGEK